MSAAPGTSEPGAQDDRPAIACRPPECRKFGGSWDSSLLCDPSAIPALQMLPPLVPESSARKGTHSSRSLTFRRSERPCPYVSCRCDPVPLVAGAGHDVGQQAIRRRDVANAAELGQALAIALLAIGEPDSPVGTTWAAASAVAARSVSGRMTMLAYWTASLNPPARRRRAVSPD